MDGFVNGGLKPRRRRRRQFNDDGQRLAVLRAFTGAKLYLAGWFASLADAAKSVGSNVHYLAAVIILLRSENVSLLNRVLANDVPLLAAAAQTKRLARLVSAYRSSSAADLKRFCDLTGVTNDLADHLVHSAPSERAAAARVLGPEVVWDEMIMPLIAEDRQSAPTN
jgi:hypothetical protein